MGQYNGDDTTGFQSPAQDYIEGVVDLTAILDLRRPGRYPVRVKGQALAARGIHDGDILVADAAAEPRAGVVWVLKPSSGALITIADDVEVWAIVQALVRTNV